MSARFTSRAVAFAAFAVGGVCAACGARTELEAPLTGALADAAGMDVLPADVMTDVPLEGPPDVRDTGAPDAPPTGCTSDADCNDGVSCTVDRCDEATGVCSHEPRDSLCPPGFTCQPPAGCVASAFAVTDTELYGVELPAATVDGIGATKETLDDIALSPDGVLYGVSETSFYKVSPTTGKVTLIARIAGSPNALDFGSDGTLYGAGSNVVFTIDPATGAETTFATYPDGYTSSGDLAIIGRQLLASAAGGSEDVLVTIDLDTRAGNVVGPMGFGCVWGLAAYGTTLFGFTCNGEVIQIDRNTGKGTLLATPGESFYGASAR